MPRRAIVFHGTGATPDVAWYRWLAGRLERRGLAVEVPHHPGTNVEPLATFLPTVLAAHTFDAETVLVGHSGGAALLLALLERLDAPVAQAVLVAGYSTPPGARQEPVLQETYDWARIRGNAREFVFVNSVDDPYGCDAAQGRVLLDRLGGTLVVRPRGHFGDADDPVPDVPVAGASDRLTALRQAGTPHSAQVARSVTVTVTVSVVRVGGETATTASRTSWASRYVPSPGDRDDDVRDQRVALAVPHVADVAPS